MPENPVYSRDDGHFIYLATVELGLMFVPGVTLQQIEEAKNLFHAVQAEMNEVDFIDEDKSNSLFQCRKMKKEEEQSENSEKKIAIKSLVDAKITDVYRGVARRRPFISYCISKGKTMMSELTDEDFEEALKLKLKGLGQTSVEQLHNIYRKFMQGDINSFDLYSGNEIKTTRFNDLTIERVFGSLTRGRLFVKYCHENGMRNMVDLIKFPFYGAQIDGISRNTMEKFYKKYLEILSHYREEVVKESSALEDIPLENRNLSLHLLSNIGISKEVISKLHKYGYKTIQDLYKSKLSLYYFELMRDAIDFLKIPVPQRFKNLLSNRQERAKKCLVLRSQGHTLQKIADQIGVTRERVRQIISRECGYLVSMADMVGHCLLSPGKIWFSYSELKELFADLELSSCCKLVLIQTSSEFEYIQFSDKFVLKTHFTPEYQLFLQQLLNEVVEDGVNFYEHIELIESELNKLNLEFLDIEDIMNYLIKEGYHFYGDFVARGSAPYGLICHDAILKYFDFDIKLDSDGDNEDMKKLRKIIDKHYHGLRLPDNNRALTAGVTRSSSIILSGRGRYCPIEKVIYSTSLFEEMHKYIQESEKTSIYYSELFSVFKGRLLAETNISNHHFLHGVLMYLYPDDFKYERDLLVKYGATRQSIDDQLSELIISNGKALSKREIKEAFPGIKDHAFAFAVVRVPRLIQWEYNMYNHMDNIDFSKDDYEALEDLVSSEIKSRGGYLSEQHLFAAVNRDYPIFIEKNHIKNSLNLYYVIAFLFDHKFRFRKPHILDFDFPVEELTVSSIANALLGNKSTLSYSEFSSLAESVGWPRGTQSAVFAEIERDYVRISEDEYILKNRFVLSNKFIDCVSQKIARLVNRTGYYALNSIFDFKDFPESLYDWNGFLLESIISEYETGFIVISPQVRDRRYQRGIIVPEDCDISSFEELVASLLRKNGITKLSEAELIRFLQMRGLIANVIPQELYECSVMSFHNDVFSLKI